MTIELHLHHLTGARAWVIFQDMGDHLQVFVSLRTSTNLPAGRYADEAERRELLAWAEQVAHGLQPPYPPGWSLPV